MDDPISYRAAGVDIDAARRHATAIAPLVAGGTAGFAAARPLPADMRNPLIVTAADGVGTKLLLARALGWVEGLGQDLVAMCVNDLACTGADALGFLDYLAVGALDADEAMTLIAGIAEACAASGCELVGGETAEMPGLYAPGHFDLAGFAYGVVERDELWGPHRVQPGDLVVGIPSSGLHSNGFTLVRALVDQGALAPNPTLLLAPTRLHAPELAALRRAGVPVHSAAHITGGGLAQNLPRAMPEGLRAALDPATWSIGQAAEAILATERVSLDDAWATFNMGLGMCVVVPQSALDGALAVIGDARTVGWVEEGEPGVRFA